MKFSKNVLLILVIIGPSSLQVLNFRRQFMKSIPVAYLLCIFLGFFGVHKFYLNRPGTGIFYLLCTVFGAATFELVIGIIPLALVGILWLIDLLTIPLQVSQTNTTTASDVA